eukprot:Sspe_Gene.62747::Locus_35446_Transcript_1_1_Confidence_1.000_Length_1173::g.62747::m.62747
MTGRRGVVLATVLLLSGGVLFSVLDGWQLDPIDHTHHSPHPVARTTTPPALSKRTVLDDSVEEKRAGEQDTHSEGVVNEEAEAEEMKHLLDRAPLDLSVTTRCNHTFTDSKTNEKYAAALKTILSGLRVHWWLDEGGLIGAARGGAMRNADDDFDFFATLPNQTATAAFHDSATPHRDFEKEMHRFLLAFWNAGMCVNHFDPVFERFESKRRLMWSLMFNNKAVRQPQATIPGQRCFDHKGSFAHMHLGLLTKDGKALHTNVWSKGHPSDLLPLDLILPVRKCRAGNQDVPCPRKVVDYLMLRNNREYARSKSDGNCLLIRKKWNMERRKAMAETVKALDACGFASLAPLIPKLEKSGYTTCYLLTLTPHVW